VGLKDEGGALETLQSNIEKALESAGFPMAQRSFSPHLTLARVKSPKGKEKLKDELDAVNRKASTLTRLMWLGSIYTKAN
jgi:2'-5' RNA ligase